jgi:hypothetical protein
MTVDDTGTQLGVDLPVRVYPETPDEQHGVVVEDFGDLAGISVEIAGNEIVGPARRWAVRLASGDVVFVDSDQLVAAEPEQ